MRLRAGNQRNRGSVAQAVLDVASRKAGVCLRFGQRPHFAQRLPVCVDCGFKRNVSGGVAGFPIGAGSGYPAIPFRRKRATMKRDKVGAPYGFERGGALVAGVVLGGGCLLM
jgi:hypothetical protein